MSELIRYNSKVILNHKHDGQLSFVCLKSKSLDGDFGFNQRQKRLIANLLSTGYKDVK